MSKKTSKAKAAEPTSSALTALLLKRSKVAGIKSPSRQSSAAGATPAAKGAPA